MLKKNGDAIAGAVIANPKAAAAAETAAMDNFMASSKVVASNPVRLTIAVAAAVNEQIESIQKSCPPYERPRVLTSAMGTSRYLAVVHETHLRNRSLHLGPVWMVVGSTKCDSALVPEAGFIQSSESTKRTGGKIVEWHPHKRWRSIISEHEGRDAKPLDSDLVLRVIASL